MEGEGEEREQKAENSENQGSGFRVQALPSDRDLFSEAVPEP
jgi:hypothetical protein